MGMGARMGARMEMEVETNEGDGGKLAFGDCMYYERRVRRGGVYWW
jgi:hypothetical protein